MIYTTSHYYNTLYLI